MNESTPHTMNCPVCHQHMEHRKQDTSHNKDQTKFYDRHFFVCRTDDVWIRLEIPQRVLSAQL